MARGRMLNATIAKDKQLNGLSIEAEYIYLKTIPHLDRDGLINGDPTLLWSDVCPRRPELMPQMTELISEIVSSGLAVSYHCELEDDTVLFFLGFHKNNKAMRYDRESPSKFSLPPGYKRTNEGLKPLGESDDTEDNALDGQETPEENGKESEVPTESRQSPDKIPYKDKDQIKDQGRDHACALEDAGKSTPTATPPSPECSDSPTGDPMLDIAWRKHNGGKKYLNGRKDSLDSMQAKLRRFDLSAEQFTQMVNAHLKNKGTLTLANGDDDAAERELAKAQEFVLGLCGTGKRFWSPEGVDLVWKSWETNVTMPDPSEHQLLQHASKIVEGKVKQKKGAVGKPSGVIIGAAENLR